ncbi:olfactory receptor 5T1-like [Equus asinus]|nr:olfactory receptor 5T3-like [Equus asinus]
MPELPSDVDLYTIQVKNTSEVTMFILVGFLGDFEVQLFLFLLFLTIYLFTLVGNLGLIVLVIGDSRLHNPMYYFLSVLSFLDACLSSVVTPKMLINFLSENKTISFLGCAAQMFFYVTFATTECFLLAAMAYDRYVAIYNPLLYSVNMSPRVYVPLIIISYLCGIFNASVHTGATFTLSFCASNEIRHFFCDIPPVLAISCSDTSKNHLLVFYFTGIIEIVTILIVLVIPMLNPIIYSLRNKDAKEAVKRVFGKN